MSVFNVEMAVPGKGTFKAPFDTAKSEPQWSQFWLGPEVLAGCHAYVTLFRGGLARVDLRVSNGSVRPSGTGHNGKIYFTGLDVRGPRGTEVVTIPRFGEKVTGSLYSVVQPLQGNSKHVLLPRAAFMRTFVLAPLGRRTEALKVLNRDPIRIPNPIKNWGPLEVDFPTIDRAASDARFKITVDGLRGALASGAKYWAQDFCDLQAPIGYTRLDGESSAGAPGGYGIELSQADCQSRWAFVLREHMAQLVMDGRNYSAYHADTGQPIRCGEWTTPMHERNRADNGRLEMPCFMDEQNGEFRHKVYNPQYEGTCPYEKDKWVNNATGTTVTVPEVFLSDAAFEVWMGKHTFFPGLASIEAHDVAHFVRAYRHLICVVETTNEQWAKDELLMLYEFARTGEWSNRPDEKVAPDYPGQWVFPSLAKKLYDANERPHQGSWLERSYGDFMWLTGEILNLFPGRDDVADDANNLRLLAVLAADKFGITACAWKNASPEYFPNPDDAGYQCFHVGRVCNGLLALCKQLYGPVPPDALDVLVRAYQTTNETFPIRDLGNAKSPPKWVSTERAGVHHTSLSQSYVSIEGDPVPWFPLHMGAMLYRETGQAKYLAWALKYFFPHATPAERLAWCQGEKYKGLIGDYEGVLEASLG